MFEPTSEPSRVIVSSTLRHFDRVSSSGASIARLRLEESSSLGDRYERLVRVRAKKRAHTSLKHGRNLDLELTATCHSALATHENEPTPNAQMP